MSDMIHQDDEIGQLDLVETLVTTVAAKNVRNR